MVSTELKGFNYCYRTKILIRIWIIYLQTVKLFQVVLFNINYHIQYYLFICSQLNGSKNCYAIPIIQFWHAVKEFQVLLFNHNNYFQHSSFVCTQLNISKYYVSLIIQFKSHFTPQLNSQRVISLTIIFDISHLFALNLNAKQSYFTYW